jgi:hypothetical protein
MALPGNPARTLAAAAVITTGSVLLAPAIAVGALGAVGFTAGGVAAGKTPFPLDRLLAMLTDKMPTRNARLYRRCIAVCDLGCNDWGDFQRLASCRSNHGRSSGCSSGWWGRGCRSWCWDAVKLLRILSCCYGFRFIDNYYHCTSSLESV